MELVNEHDQTRRGGTWGEKCHDHREKEERVAGLQKNSGGRNNCEVTLGHSTCLLPGSDRRVPRSAPEAAWEATRYEANRRDSEIPTYLLYL